MTRTTPLLALLVLALTQAPRPAAASEPRNLGLKAVLQRAAGVLGLSPRVGTSTRRLGARIHLLRGSGFFELRDRLGGLSPMPEAKRADLFDYAVRRPAEQAEQLRRNPFTLKQPGLLFRLLGNRAMRLTFDKDLATDRKPTHTIVRSPVREDRRQPGTFRELAVVFERLYQGDKLAGTILTTYERTAQPRPGLPRFLWKWSEPKQVRHLERAVDARGKLVPAAARSGHPPIKIGYF